MTESFLDQLSRVSQMVDDEAGETWDLSPKDRAALQALLNDYDRFKILSHLMRGKAVTVSHRRDELTIHLNFNSADEAIMIFQELTK